MVPPDYRVTLPPRACLRPITQLHANILAALSNISMNTRQRLRQPPQLFFPPSTFSLLIFSCPYPLFPSAVCAECLSECRLSRLRGILTIPSPLPQELSLSPTFHGFACALFVMLKYPCYRSEGELAINIRKATSIEETAPKRKHVRSCIVYTWDHKSSGAFWAGMKVLVISFISLLL